MKIQKKLQYMGGAGIIIMALLLLCVMLLALRFGSSAMSWSVFWHGLLGAEGYETQRVILYTIRLPRILAGLLAGVGLSVSGVLLQSVTGNALASPNIIGVNAGAGFFVILLLCLCPTAFYILPLAAFFGAFLATLLIISVANKIGTSKTTVILAGIALTAVLNAGISFISLLDTDVLTAYTYFSIGSLAGIQIKSLAVPAAIIFLSLVVMLVFSKKINLLCLGDAMAASLGVRVKALQMLCLVCASAAAAAVVSFAGLLGFVGLVVPHIARKLAGTDTKHTLITASLAGAIVVILGDLLGRIVFAPSELPVGIMMALIGAPFFFILLLRKRTDV